MVYVRPLRAHGREWFGGYRIFWENPGGPYDSEAGLTVQKRARDGRVKWEQRVGPRGMLTVTEAAAALRISRRAAYFRVERGQLRAVFYRGQWMVPVSEVKRSVAEQLTIDD